MIASSKLLDIEGTKDFKQIQEVVYRTMKLTGGAIVLLPIVKKGNVSFQKVKVLESHHLKNKDGKEDTSNLTGGIEEDANGEISKYHILKQHPNSSVNGVEEEWVIIPAKSDIKHNVLHYYKQERAGQKKGIPYLSAVLDTLRKLTDFSEAELDAAILNARYAGFIFNDNPPQLGGMDEEEDTKEKEPMQLKKGNLIQLPQGWKVDFANPSRPNANYATFAEAQLKELCVGLNLSYEMFLKHFRASYSASRGAVVEGKKYFKSERHDLASSVCQPIFENIILQLVIDKTLYLPGFLTDPMTRMAWLGSVWVGDAQEELDKLKAGKGSKLLIEEGLSTRDREAKEINGTNYNRNVAIAEDETSKLELSKIPYIGVVNENN